METGACPGPGSIREAVTSADLEEVRQLFREYGEALAAAPEAGICISGLAREIVSLPAPYLAVLLAEADGHSLGCVALKPGRVSDACEMKRLYVRPAARGRDLGRQLILAAMSHARGRGYRWLYLDTAPAAMPAAQHLYKSLGFEPTGRFNDNPVPGIVFFRHSLTG